MRLINLRPPRIALLLTMLAAAVHWAFHHGEPMRLFLPWTGALSGALGFCLVTWSWLIFKRQKLAVCPLQATSHITDAGPYRFSRNPMYLGMFVMMLGLALAAGTLPFYLSAVGYAAIMNFVFCPYEEGKLEVAFGQEYLRYRDTVHRWL